MTLFDTVKARSVVGFAHSDRNRDLPEGWSWTMLEELVIDLSNGFGKRRQAAGIPHLVFRLADLREGELSVNQARRINATEAEVEQYGLIQGDLLFVRVNGSADLVGRATRYAACSEVALYCDHFIRARPSLAEFGWVIRTYCDSPDARWFVEQNKVSSAGQNTISQASLRSLPIPLPPLAEQKRIAAKVESVLAKVNEARQRLAKVPAILKRFRQSVLAAAATGELTLLFRAATMQEECCQPASSDGSELPAGWRKANASEVFSFVTSGSRGWAKYYANEGPLFLRVGNLNHDSITLDLNQTQRVRPPASAETERTRVKPGDILITVTAEVGMIAVVPAGIGEAYVNQHVAIARPMASILKEFVAIYLASPCGGQLQFEELRRGATKAGLGLDDIRALSIPLPPLPEQHEIVRRVSALFALADKVEARLAAATAAVERVTQAVLAKAFRGELVETEASLARREGRDYEPAAKLLERVKADSMTALRPNPKRRRAKAID